MPKNVGVRKSDIFHTSAKQTTKISTFLTSGLHPEPPNRAFDGQTKVSPEPIPIGWRRVSRSTHGVTGDGGGLKKRGMAQIHFPS